MNPTLECKHISKTFGRSIAVSEVSLAMNHGEIVSILGPSGCGKTTLLRMIAGLENPDAGTISLEGNDVYNETTNVPSENRNLGMVFQEYALFPHLTVEQNLAFGIELKDKKEKIQRIQKITELTQLTGFSDRYPHELSGGQQQRTALARTLATEPTLLLMDEPFSNLDASLRQSVRSQVETIIRASGTSTIFVTHDKEEAYSISDRVAIMYEGSIHQVAPPDQIYFWPLTKEVAELGGTCDFLTGTIHDHVAKTSAGPLPLRLPGQYANGTNIVVAIRPNDLMMTPSPNGENAVVRKEFRGDDTIFWVQTPKQEILRCKHKTHTTLFTGLKVTLTPDKYAKFNVFPE